MSFVAIPAVPDALVTERDAAGRRTGASARRIKRGPIKRGLWRSPAGSVLDWQIQSSIRLLQRADAGGFE